MTGIIELTTTTETETQARALARLLVDARLAACVQIVGPIQSIYRWQGEIQDGVEFRCTCKSLKALIDPLVDAISRNHPYETPEILIVDVVHCSPAYADWLRSQVE